MKVCGGRFSWEWTRWGAGVLGVFLGCGPAAIGDDDTAPVDDDATGDDTGADDDTSADDDTTAVEAWADPTGWGPYAVGAREATAWDEAWQQEIDLWVWYPALPSGAEPLFTFGVAVQDAEPAAPVAPWPLVVFSHGYEGVNIQSIFFTERLASHGYVVAAPNHPHNTFYDNDEDYAVEVAVNRPRDCSATLDWLLAANRDPGDPLYGRLDEERAAVSGHSYGGYTTAAAMGWVFEDAIFGAADELEALGLTPPFSLGDPRFLAGVSMTPCGATFAGTSGLDEIHGPMLYFGGDLDGICPVDTEVSPMWEASPDPAWLAVVEGAGHYGFSNFCDILPGQSDECGPPYRDDAEIQAVTNALSVDFLGLYLRGDDRYGDVLDGAESLYTGVSVEH